MFIASDENNYIVNLEENSDWIISQVEGLMAESQKANGIKTLLNQLKFGTGANFSDSLMSDMKNSGFEVSDSNDFDYFSNETNELGQAGLATVTGHGDVDLIRRIQHAKSLEIPKKRLVLRFE